ncbi:hypothetical protein C1646_767073 [Rhizophagus diaphanus]|nr:hypothetical protein C1646_767073 [Rhizophagus diaphanus] [Rhizophagus sp. MUCL 43196]
MLRKFIIKAIDKFKTEETKFYNDVIVYIGKEPDIKEFHLNFKILASRDGNTAAAFHAKCDNKGATVVIVKIRNLDQIVIHFFWDPSKTDKSTKDSFLFKFTDKNNLLGANVVYSKGDRYSVRCYLGSGPFFGYGDLYVNYYPDVWYS